MIVNCRLRFYDHDNETLYSATLVRRLCSGADDGGGAGGTGKGSPRKSRVTPHDACSDDESENSSFLALLLGLMWAVGVGLVRVCVGALVFIVVLLRLPQLTALLPE